jgi:DNA primase
MAAAVQVAHMIRRALDPAGINLMHATGAAGLAVGLPLPPAPGAAVSG